MNLVERVKGILLAPKTEWPVIATEPGDVGYLFTNYVAILAAIPAICGLIGWTVSGLPLGTGLISAIIRYLLTFVVVYIVALIIDALAPTFGGTKDFSSALKVAVYSYTPSWIGGIFLLVPGLRFLAALAALYGLYLLWAGLPPLMRSPQDRAVLYTVAVVVAAIVISIIVGIIIGGLIGFRGLV